MPYAYGSHVRALPPASCPITDQRATNCHMRALCRRQKSERKTSACAIDEGATHPHGIVYARVGSAAEVGVRLAVKAAACDWGASRGVGAERIGKELERRTGRMLERRNGNIRSSGTTPGPKAELMWAALVIPWISTVPLRAAAE